MYIKNTPFSSARQRTAAGGYTWWDIDGDGCWIACMPSDKRPGDDWFDYVIDPAGAASPIRGIIMLDPEAEDPANPVRLSLLSKCEPGYTSLESIRAFMIHALGTGLVEKVETLVIGID